MKIQHNKLVRDKIPEIIKDSGNQYETTTLSNLDYIEALSEKLVEEAKEVATASPDKLTEELADVMEVIETLIAATGIELETVREIQKEKRSLRGGFDNKIKLLWTISSSNQ